MTQIGLGKKCYVSNQAQKNYYFETHSSHLYLRWMAYDQYKQEQNYLTNMNMYDMTGSDLILLNSEHTSRQRLVLGN